jgi:hypothetical protein
MTSRAQAMEAIYQSLNADNQDIDTHIAALKKVLTDERTDSIEVDPARLPHPNRQGRKMMQAYFKQRGIIVTFPNSN